MVINLISGPRNVSTALMYAFAQRGDTAVMDEPFYAVFLGKTGVAHPGAEVVMRNMSHDEHTVREHILSRTDKPVVFVKNMAHHMEVLEEPLLPGATNVFLIRHPRLILASYSAVISHPVMRDIGTAWQYELFSRLRALGTSPVVLDSSFLLDNPPAILSQLCQACGLTFDQRMVHWPAGPKPYDGVWAPYWYGNVHRSTGFERKLPLSPGLPPHLRQLCEEATFWYEKLLPFSLKT